MSEKSRVPSSGASRIPQIPPSTFYHLRQRRATGAMLDRVRVQVALRRYGGPRGGTARVVIDGEFYEVSAAVLEALEEGYTPESLQLEPLDCDVEDW